MKHFMIKYRFEQGTKEDWHREITRFITALDSEPALKGKISYRCMNVKGEADYYHIAGAADEQAIKTLQSQEFFKRYNEQTRRVADGKVEVVPLEIVAETEFRA